MKKEEKEYWKEVSVRLTATGTNAIGSFNLALCKNGYSFKTIIVARNTFANCQTVTIGSAYKLAEIPKYAFERLISIIYSIIGKRQLVIDVTNNYKKSILKTFEDISSNIQSLDYISTNGSKMVIIIIHLSDSKLSTILGHLSRNNISYPDSHYNESVLQTYTHTNKKEATVKEKIIKVVETVKDNLGNSEKNPYIEEGDFPVRRPSGVIPPTLFNRRRNERFSIFSKIGGMF